jgi:hypothetical protein
MARFFSIILLLANPVVSVAQTQVPPRGKPSLIAQSTDDRGLLLGVYFSKSVSWEMIQNATQQTLAPDLFSDPQGTYLTFWIARIHGELKVHIVAGLLVPRSDGFWRVGSYIVKSRDAEDADVDEQFWATPAGEKQPDLPRFDSDVNGNGARIITYAGPEYISHSLHWQGGAGMWDYVQTYVESLDNLKKDLTIEQVLGPKASAEYKRLAKSLDHMDYQPKPGEERDACNCCAGREEEWGIVHIGDSWRSFARFHSGTSSACAQDSNDQFLKTPLPQSLWSGGRPDQPWETLRKQIEAIPGSGSVQHLFLSPKHDFAVAIGTTGLTILDIKNARSSLIHHQAFAAACLPVSEQWSTGRFVGPWDAELGKQPSAAIPEPESDSPRE